MFVVGFLPQAAERECGGVCLLTAHNYKRRMTMNIQRPHRQVTHIQMVSSSNHQRQHRGSSIPRHSRLSLGIYYKVTIIISILLLSSLCQEALAQQRETKVHRIYHPPISSEVAKVMKDPELLTTYITAYKMLTFLNKATAPSSSLSLSVSRVK